MIGKPTRHGVTRLVAGAAVAAASMFTVGMAFASPASAAATEITVTGPQTNPVAGSTTTVSVNYSGTPSAAGTGANTGGLLIDITSGADARTAGESCTVTGTGTATCTLKNNSTPTTDTVRVFDDANQNGTFDSGEAENTASVQFVAPSYSSVRLTCKDAANGGANTGACTIPTGTPAESFTVTVTNGGTPVNGVSISLTSTSGATVPATVTTGTDGTATFSATGDPTADGASYTVTATGPAATAPGGNAISDEAMVTYADRAPDTLNLTPTTQTKLVGGSASVTATVDDQFGAAVQGESVTFTVAAGSRNANTTTTRTTGANGTAAFSYNDNPASPGVYTDTIDASAEGGDLVDHATVNWLTSTTPDSVDAAVTAVDSTSCDPVTGSGTANTPASTSYAEQFCFEVDNSDGQVLPNATVTVAVDKGFVGTTDAATPAATKSVQITTGSDGQGVAYVGSAVSGVQTITATDGAATGSATVTYTPGEATSVTLTPRNATITPGTSKSYTATVSDDLGNGVPDQQVTFTRQGPGVVLTQTPNGPTGGASATTTTDAAGVATVSLQTTTNEVGPGTLTVDLADSDLTTSTGYNIGTALTTVTAYVPNRTAGQSDYVGSRAFDQDGKPLAGAELTFTITGANPSTRTITTGSDGTATYTFTATHAGAMTVTVTGPNGTPSVTTHSTVAQIQAKTTLKLASASKGKVTATATVSPTSLAGQIVGFYTVVGSKVTYVGQSRVGASNHAAIVTFSGLKSGAKVSYEARVVGNTDVNSPFSNVASTTVK